MLEDFWNIFDQATGWLRPTPTIHFKDLPEARLLPFSHWVGKTVEKRIGSKLSQERIPIISEARARFVESLIALEKRLYEVKHSTAVFMHLDREKTDYMVSTTLQLDVVKKIEAYHQQVYATLSAYIMLSRKISPANVYNNIPTRSLKKFLDYLKSLSPPVGGLFSRHIDCLEESRQFRAKFIDHPQQHALHSWMTMGAFPELVIGYYTPLLTRDEIEQYIKDLSGKAPMLAFPLPPHKDFYMSPLCWQTHHSLKRFVAYHLRYTCKLYETENQE